MDFRYPWILVLYAIPAFLVVYRWATRRQRSRELDEWGNSRVRERLFGRVNSRSNIWKRRLRFSAMVLLILAASGPRVGTQVVEIQRTGADILVALDVSSSMRAEDVKPSRLEKAKFEISRLISRLKGDRIGIIVFAGSPHLYLPLTGDYHAAKLFVEAIDTDMIQMQGTAIAEAIRMARSSFPDPQGRHRVIVVVTDGEDHEGRALQAAGEADDEGIALVTVGVGTSTGSLIPIFDDRGNRVDYKKDKNGKLVTTRLHGGTLRELAEEGGGSYVQFDNRAGDPDDLLEPIQAVEKRTLKSQEYSQFEDRFQPAAAGALLLFLVELFLPSGRRKKDVWRGRFV